MGSAEKIIGAISSALERNPHGLTVTEISSETGVSRNTVSKYLDILRISGNLDMRTFGPAKVYTLSNRIPVRSVIDMASNMILVVDRDLRVIQANDSLLRLLQTNREKFLGLTIDRYRIPILSEQYVVDALRAALEGDSRSMEGSWTLDGQQYHLDIRSVPTTLGDGSPGATVIVDDVTQERIDHDRVVESESKYRSIFQCSKDALILTDFQGYFECNKALKDLIGSDDEVWIRNNMFNIHPERQPDGKDSLQFIEENIEGMIQGRSDRFEWHSYDRDGNSVFSEITTNPVRINDRTLFHLTIRDMTEQKKMSMDLQKRDMLIQSLLSIMEMVLDERDIDTAVMGILSRLGKGTKTSSCYVFLNRAIPDRTVSRLRYLWMNGSYDGDDARQGPKEIDLGDMTEEPGFTLSRGGTIIRTLSTISPRFREMMSSFGIRSLISVPIFDRNGWIGFLGFEDRSEERTWSEDEVRILRIAGRMISHIMFERAEKPSRDPFSAEPLISTE